MTLATHFSEQELQPIKSGMRTFIRLTGMIHHEHQYRWFADEADAVSALKSIARAFQSSARMLGQSKYQGQPFDAVRQAREDLAGSLLTADTEPGTAAARKRYSPLYYLILEPVINLFNKFDHQTILNIIDECIAEFVTMMEATDCYGDMDDALIAQEMTRTLIRNREEALKAVKQSRRKSKKKVVEIVEEEETTEEEA